MPGYESPDECPDTIDRPEVGKEGRRRGVGKDGRKKRQEQRGDEEHGEERSEKRNGARLEKEWKEKEKGTEI